MQFKKLFLVPVMLILFAAIMMSKADDTLPKAFIRAVAWSPDGSQIAYSQNDGVVKVQNLLDQQMIHQFQGTYLTPINVLTFSDQGDSLIAGATDGVIRKWDINTDELLYSTPPSPFLITGLDLNPVHPNTLAVVSYQGQLSLVDTDTGNVTLILDVGGMGEDFDVDWNADGTQLATASGGTIALWDNTGKRLSSINDLTGELVAVDWNSHDINTIVAVTNVGTMKTWDTATGKEIKTFALNTTDGFTAAEFSPDGSKIVTTSYGGKLIIWDSETGEMLTVIENKSSLLTAAWSPDGTKIAYAGESGELHVVDVPTVEATPEPSITAVAWSPDGRKIVEGSADGFLRVWDSSGHALLDLKGVIGTIRSVDWSPDSTKIVSGGDDKLVRVWDTNTGDLLATMKGHDDVIESVDWSPDGNKIVSASFNDLNTLRVWDATTFQSIAMKQAGTLLDVEWNKDSNKIAVANANGYLNILDSLLSESKGPSALDGAVISVSWSPNGKMIATGDANKTIHIWDTKTYQETAIFRGHNDLVGDIEFSPDGQKLASASPDNTIRIWNIETGQEISSFPTTQAVLLWSIAWSPDGSKIVYGDSNHTIKIVDVPTVEITPASP